MTFSDSRLVLANTESVCPDCLATVPAIRYAEGDTVYLEKTCPQHGTTSTPIWRGLKSYFLWDASPRNRSRVPKPATVVHEGCPRDCGLCPDHQQQSCCVLLEVTSRCDLACPVCFASATRKGEDISFDTIEAWLDTLMERAGGRVHIQLSGGEPTVRDDLPEIVALARRKGFSFVQVNTNGVRIAKHPDYLEALVAAGLDCVFLQFDGVTDDVHQKLRGAKLARVKLQAVEACGRAGVGVVLVPTLVPGVNTGQIGAIVEFAKAHMPTVRAVHFQPISYFGRVPAPPRPETRFTLPEVMEALIEHEQGGIRLSDFHPGSAENPFCSFAGRFLVGKDGRLSVDRDAPVSCCGAPPEEEASCCCGEGHVEEEHSCCGGSKDAGEDHGCCGGSKGEEDAHSCCGGGNEAEAGHTCCGGSAAHEEEQGCCCGSARDPASDEAAAPAADARPSADVARARRYVADQWTMAAAPEGDAPGLAAFDAVLQRRAHSLGLSAMVFQDAWTLDLERLRQCHIHVMSPDQRAIPFCAHNLTDREGHSLYRGHTG
ncbi:radical SAM (seleno)protein TrsS [Breoghania sp. JC706]|uniref:radical SAM (seleno)protein TrsS n=1 Tax=Breoghania sp. JC706 TaxID=3117732 RepID=UPI003008EEB9